MSEPAVHPHVALVVHPWSALVLDELVEIPRDAVLAGTAATLRVLSGVVPGDVWPLGPDRVAGGIVVHVVAARDDRPRAGAGWTGAPPHSWPDAAREAATALLATLDDPPPLRPPWMRRGWWDAATAWVDEVLHVCMSAPRVGPLVPTKAWGISALARVHTEAQTVWLKALPPLFAREPHVLRMVGGVLATVLADDTSAPRVPDVVVSADDDLGVRMLVTDVGPVPDDAEPGDTGRLAAQLARLQVAAAGPLPVLADVARLDDRRPVALAEGLARLVEDGVELPLLDDDERRALRAGLPARRDALLALDTTGLPDVVLHGDFHVWNVARRPGWIEGDEAIIDWTDAAVGPVGADLATLVRFDAPAADVDAVVLPYAAVWTQATGLAEADVLRGVRAGLAAGRVVQALAYEGITRSLEPVAAGAMRGAQAANLRAVIAQDRG